MQKLTRDKYRCLKRINRDCDIPVEDMFAVQKLELILKP